MSIDWWFLISKEEKTWKTKETPKKKASVYQHFCRSGWKNDIVYPKKRRRKKHQYTSIFADLDGRMILSTKLLRGKKSDNRMMIPTIEKAKELFNQIISNDADKGYDAEYNHEYNNEVIGAEDYIKLKNKEVPVRRTRGANRKKAKAKARRKKGRPRKNHRNKIESIIFVLKKVLGEHISATSAAGQRQQTRFRIIAHNAYVKAKRFLIGFLRHLLKKFYFALRSE